MLTLTKLRQLWKCLPPQNKEDIRILQGTVGYLARFLPHLSQVMEPLREPISHGVLTNKSHLMRSSVWSHQLLF